MRNAMASAPLRDIIIIKLTVHWFPNCLEKYPMIIIPITKIKSEIKKRIFTLNLKIRWAIITCISEVANCVVKLASDDPVA